MFRLVADNTVDFAIMNTNLNTPDYLTTETILYEKILLVGNRGNRAAQALAEACRAGREPELSVLEHERFVLLYPRDPARHARQQLSRTGAYHRRKRSLHHQRHHSAESDGGKLRLLLRQ